MKCLDIFLFLLFAVHAYCDHISEEFTVEKQKAMIYSRKTKDDVSVEDEIQTEQVASTAAEKVDIQVFYEVFCPHCRNFDTQKFKPVVEKLHPYLNIQTYPYGNAQTVERDDGEYEFTCQHGPTECYGNKLHGCALDIIKNETTALLYNICMMKYSNTDLGSDDNAADRCGSSMAIDSTKIKECAKGKRGNELLRNYGVVSKKAGFKHVPYVLINGVKNNVQNFMRDVCAAFSKPPQPCASL